MMSQNKQLHQWLVLFSVVLQCDPLNFAHRPNCVWLVREQFVDSLLQVTETHSGFNGTVQTITHETKHTA